MKRWTQDNESDFCVACNEKFSLFIRRHHCRACGRLLCNDCSSNWMLIPQQMLDMVQGQPISNDPIAPTPVDPASCPQRCCHSCAR